MKTHTTLSVIDMVAMSIETRGPWGVQDCLCSGCYSSPANGHIEAVHSGWARSANWYELKLAHVPVPAQDICNEDKRSRRKWHRSLLWSLKACNVIRGGRRPTATECSVLQWPTEFWTECRRCLPKVEMLEVLSAELAKINYCTALLANDIVSLPS